MIRTASIVENIEKEAVRFQGIEDLQPLVTAASKAKYILLGEASHGTSEFYTIRAALTKQLIEQEHCLFVAVEGDWPSCFEVNRYVKGHAPEYKSAREALQAFNRWPSWMWANEEMIDLIEWMKAFNDKKEDGQKKVGFYGLDMYSLWESMEEIIRYLQRINSPDVEQAKKAFSCFEPFHRKPEKYGISAAFYGEDCTEEVVQLLHTIQQRRHTYTKAEEADLNMEVNSLVVSSGEAYYHAMVTSDNTSWNIRDGHMVEALACISEYYGQEAKGIVWEHNTHIGDARATDMKAQGMENVGQLARERYGEENVYAIGFGTYQGSVIAGRGWGEVPEVMPVPQAAEGSWEYLVHKAGAFNKYLLFTKENHHLFTETLGHRAIGVVYHPEFEYLGNYVPSRLSDRYDAFIHVEQTKALSPLILQPSL